MSTTPAISLGQSTASVPLCQCESLGSSSSLTKGEQGARHWRELALLLGLWLLHCAGNFWWLTTDTRPPYSDMAGHAITALRLASWPWRQWVMDGGIVHALLTVNPYPPFFYVTTLPLIWFVGPSADRMLIVNMLYFGVLIFATYGIGRLAVSGSTGLLAAFLVSMYPLIYGLSRQYLADVALTAVTAFAIFCLFWSRSFERRWPSLILGVTIGVGVLTKWTFIVFLVGPLAIAVYLTLRHATRARWINMIMAGVISLVIGLPWFLANLAELRAFLQFNSVLAAPQEGEAPIWSLESWLYYVDKLLTHQILVPFTLLLGVGGVLALRRCRLNAYLWMLLMWIVVGYVASTLFINKDTRYTMPYLPALALLTAIGLVQIRQTIVRWVGLALIVLYALVQYVGLTVGLSGYITGVSTYMYFSLGKMPIIFYSEAVHIASPARAEDWQIDPILDAVIADAETRNVEPPTLKMPVTLLMIPTVASFDAQAFTYTKWRDRLPIEVLLVTGILEVDSASVLQQSDYVVTKSGDLGWDFVLQEAGELTTQLLDPTSTLARHFELIAQFPLPDGSVAFLFRQLREE